MPCWAMDLDMPLHSPLGSSDDAPVARAEAEQLQASNPQVSAFVSAHAGAGKTKLLIDRLLRLMLSDAEPGRILCLTFTKAAAAEMAIRLQKRLAGFVALPDAELDARLKALHIAPDAAARQRARALFARVLDLPGGMRISTTHAFCQSLLRRFPLEAQISPHFQLVEDQDARMALDRVREAVLPDAPPAAVAALAGLADAGGFAALTALLERERERLKPALGWPAGMLRAALGRVAGVTEGPEAVLIGRAVSWPDEAILRDALRRARLHGSPGVQAKAAAMEGWLNLPPEDRADYWSQWLEHLFTRAGEPCAASKFSNAKLHAAHPDIMAACVAEQARVAAVLQSCRALRCADASAALLTLAAPVLASYARDKARGGLVDYDDLIRRTVALLSPHRAEPDFSADPRAKAGTDPGANPGADPGAGPGTEAGALADAGPETNAAWVKYKLDGGIDHVLLDEVQDTSGVQWDVTDSLTGDFFAGEGAQADREQTGLGRTVFAVGDVKQSIYSFQGAQPDEFAIRRERYARQVRGAGRGLAGNGAGRVVPLHRPGAGRGGCGVRARGLGVRRVRPGLAFACAEPGGSRREAWWYGR